MMKNNIKTRKIFSALIAVLLICMTFPLSAVSASFSDVKDNKAVDVVTGLGLMEGNTDGTFTGEVQLSRGEFAHIIANLFKSGDMSAEEWKEKYFFDENDENSSETEFVPDFGVTNNAEIFDDVTTSNIYYDDIMTVYSLGLMNGVGGGMFDTESAVTLQQAVKVMINLLGYTPRAAIKGGYPNGYIIAATELKLLNGIDLSQSFNKFVMAQLLYNSLEVEMLFLTGVGDKLTYESYENVTFLSEILGLYKYEGRLMDNGYASLTGQSALISGQLMVNSKIIKNTSETSYACDYLGRDVDVYYDYEDNIAKYVCLARTDNITEIDSRDFVRFDEATNTFTYKKDEKNVDIKVADGAFLLHNGMGKSGYDNNTFDVNKGTIKIVESSKTGKRDFIILEDYHSFYVDFVDTGSKAAYSKATLAANDKKLDFEEKDGKLIVVYDANGNALEFSAIKAGSVLSVSQSDCMLKVYISNNKNDAFLVDTIETQNGINVYSGSQKYTLSEDYIQMYPSSVPNPGKVYTVYFDIFGEIVKFVENTDEKAVVVHIVKTAKEASGFDSEAMCKYYSVEGRMIISTFYDKVTVLKEDDSEVLLTTPDQVMSVLGTYNGLAKLSTNEDGYITKVELPGEQKDMNNTPGRLVRIDMGEPIEDNNILAFYFKQHQGFQGKALVSSSGTKVLEVNHQITDVNDIRTGNSLPQGVEAPDEEEDYQMASISSFKDDDTFYIRAYTTIADSPFAEYIVHYKSVIQNLDKTTTAMAVVQRIYEGIDSEGNKGTVYEAYTTASKTEKLMLAENFAGITNLADETQYTDENGETKPFVIEKGDLIRYSLDGSGKVTRMELVYDENAYNQASGGRGALAGTIGKHEGYLGGTDYGRYNPVAFDRVGAVQSGISWSSGNARFFAGSPIMVRDTAVKFTSQDLTAAGSVYNKDEEGYITESYIIGSFMHIKLEGGKVTASMQSSKALLKPYEVVGNDCNRVVMMVRIGAVQRAVVYEGFLD